MAAPPSHLPTPESLGIACSHTERRVYCRGLCESCYSVWKRAKAPAVRHAIALRSYHKHKDDPGAKAKARARNLKYSGENPGFQAKYRYGLTSEQLIALQQFHGNKCRLCAKTSRLVVDHCHATGKVRGLLCYTCNRDVGAYERWRSRFDVMEEYLSGLEVAYNTLGSVQPNQAGSS